MQIGSITQLTENKNFPIGYINSFTNTNNQKHEFVRLSPECGDWEAWYLNGKLIAEGHHVRVTDILDALSNVFPNTYKCIEISDEKAEEGFTKDLKDML